MNLFSFFVVTTGLDCSVHLYYLSITGCAAYIASSFVLLLLTADGERLITNDEDDNNDEELSTVTSYRLVDLVIMNVSHKITRRAVFLCFVI